MARRNIAHQRQLAEQVHAAPAIHLQKRRPFQAGRAAAVDQRQGGPALGLGVGTVGADAVVGPEMQVPIRNAAQDRMVAHAHEEAGWPTRRLKRGTGGQPVGRHALREHQQISPVVHETLQPADVRGIGRRQRNPGRSRRPSANIIRVCSAGPVGGTRWHPPSRTSPPRASATRTSCRRDRTAQPAAPGSWSARPRRLWKYVDVPLLAVDELAIGGQVQVERRRRAIDLGQMNGQVTSLEVGAGHVAIEPALVELLSARPGQPPVQARSGPSGTRRCAVRTSAAASGRRSRGERHPA